MLVNTSQNKLSIQLYMKKKTRDKDCTKTFKPLKGWSNNQRQRKNTVIHIDIKILL